MRVTEWDIIKDIQKVNNEIPGKLYGTDYEEQGKYSINTVRNRFGTWKNALRNAIPDETERNQEELFEAWKEELEGLYGRYTKEELMEEIETLTKRIHMNMDDFVQWSKEKDDFQITTNKRGGNISKKKFFISSGDGFQERLQNYLEQVPEEARSKARELIGNGCNPKAVIATAKYRANDDLSQVEAAEEVGTTEVSIRRNQQEFNEIYGEKEDNEGKNN